MLCKGHLAYHVELKKKESCLVPLFRLPSSSLSRRSESNSTVKKNIRNLNKTAVKSGYPLDTVKTCI